MQTLRKFSAFTLISGVGWLIDVGMFTLLVSVNLGALIANTLSAFTAITFVWLASRGRVFLVAEDADHRSQYALYLAWHAVAVPVASVLIALVAAMVFGPVAALRSVLQIESLPEASVIAALAAKLVVTPLTLVANFRFAHWLLERHYERQ